MVSIDIRIRENLNTFLHFIYIYGNITLNFLIINILYYFLGYLKENLSEVLHS